MEDDKKIKGAVDHIHEAALFIVDYLNEQGLEPEDEEAGFYETQINILRDCADELSPPGDCWPKGEDGKGEVISMFTYRKKG